MANVNVTQVTPGVLPGFEGLVNPLYQGALDSYNLPFASYSGQLVAPFTTDQRSAFDRIAGTVNDPRYQSAFNTGIGMATGAGTPSAAYNSAIAGLGSPVNYQSVTAPTVTAGTVNPGNIGTGQFGAQALGQYMSPYLQSVVDTTTSELDRQAGKNQAALRAQLAAKGSFGDRSTLALTEQQRNADQVRANTVAQLMQGGYGQAASLFNTDQARALEAAKSNQSAGLQGGIANLNADLTANLNNAGNSLAAQRANQSTDLTAQQLYRQGLGQVAGFDVSNRGLGTQAAQVLGALGSGAQNTNLAGLQALLGSGSLQQQQQQAQDTAAYNQFLRQVGYPQQQVGNLAGILYGAPKGQTTTTPAPSDLQTAAGLGTSLLGILGGTGGFGSNGWLTSLFKADGGRVGYANGGEIDDEDDEVSAFGPLDDDENEAAGDDGDPQAGAGSVAAGLNAFGEPAGDGGGDDIVGGTGTDPVAAPGGSMRDRVNLSGYTREDLQKAAANALPQAIGAQSFFAGGIDNPLTALGLGILSSKSPHLGEALGQGGLAALTRISAQKKEAMAAEQLRQKAALAQLQMIDKSVAGDRQALNKALETETTEEGKGNRAKLHRDTQMQIADKRDKTHLDAAGISASARITAAELAARAGQFVSLGNGVVMNRKTGETMVVEEARKDPTPSPVAKLIAERDALSPDDPNRQIFDAAIKKASTTPEGASSSVGKLIAERDALPEGDPRRKNYDDAIAHATGQQPKSAQATTVGKLIAERDALPEDDPRRAIYDEAIKKATTANNGVEMTLPDGTKVTVGGGGKGGPQTGLQQGNQKEIEKELIEATGQLMQVNRIADKFKPEYQLTAEKLRNAWTAMKDRAGFKPNPTEAKALEDFTAYRAEAAQFYADRLKAMSGSAVTEGEAKRQTAYLPNPGTGLFDGDSPTELKTKNDRMRDFFGKTTARLNYIRKNGLSIENVPLDKMEGIMNDYANKVATQLKAQGLDDEAVKTATKAQLAREFGLVGR